MEYKRLEIEVGGPKPVGVCTDRNKKTSGTSYVLLCEMRDARCEM